MKGLKNFFREIKRYPTAIFGLIVVLTLIVSAVLVIVTIPYDEAITTWRGGEQVWGKNPRTVPPVWYNWFRDEKMVESMDLKEGDEGVTVEETVTEGGKK